MSTTNTKRAEVKARIRTLVQQSPLGDRGVTVATGQLPENPDRKQVILGDITGTVSPANMKAGRKDRVDRFTIEVWLIAFVAGGSAAEADELVDAMFSDFEDIFADDPKLGSTVNGLQHAYLDGPANGPNSRQTPTGWASFRSTTVACYVRNT